MTTPADGFLWLLRMEPTLLPPALAVDQATATYRRTADEIHPCLRCGDRARCAFIADTDLGPRWVDMCQGCAMWLRAGATQEPLSG